MTTTELFDSLERIDNIIKMLDEIMDQMDGFSSAEEAWLSSITETLRTWRYVMHETYESPEGDKDAGNLHVRAFTHGTSCPSAVSRTSPKCS